MPEKPVSPVILCGGSGTRLWPRSRPATPKPFLRLLGEQTLFQEALSRCADSDMFSKPIVVTGAAHVPLVDAQSRPFDPAEIIVEPQPKQTAAAVALAAARLPRDQVMLVCPSDHHVGHPEQFAEAARQAAGLARQGWLVCLGVRATTPDTRYGYVQTGESLGPASRRVARFVEKPDGATAADYVESGEFAWNAGIFAFRAGDYLDELEEYRPALAAHALAAAQTGSASGRHFHPDPAQFAAIEAESLDYAVMENTARAAIVMTDMDWSDVGTWAAIYGARDKDALGNAVRGPAELIDCRNILVETDGAKVHVIGLEDVVVVVDGDDVLVARASESGKVASLAKNASR